MSEETDDGELSRVSARLVELEVRYTHQSAEVRDLSEVVYKQQQEIERLRTRLEALEKKFTESPDDRPTDPSDEVPPHY